MDILIAFLPFGIALAACGLLKPVMYKTIKHICVNGVSVDLNPQAVTWCK